MARRDLMTLPPPPALAESQGELDRLGALVAERQAAAETGRAPPRSRRRQLTRPSGSLASKETAADPELASGRRQGRDCAIARVPSAPTFGSWERAQRAVARSQVKGRLRLCAPSCPGLQSQR